MNAKLIVLTYALFSLNPTIQSAIASDQNPNQIPVNACEASITSSVVDAGLKKYPHIQSAMDLANHLVEIDDADLPVLLAAFYPKELSSLTGNVETTAANHYDANATSEVFPSERVDGISRNERDRSVELNKTVLGVLIYKWLLANEKEKLLDVQKKANLQVLKDVSFEQLRTEALATTPDAKARHAMITSMIVNDLAKSGYYKNLIAQKLGFVNIDHDVVLLEGLRRAPQEISPEFLKMDAHYQALLINGLETKFNMGQFVRLEALPVQLSGMGALKKDSFDFYMLHFIIDLAGAAGGAFQNGSRLLTQDYFERFHLAREALRTLYSGSDITQSYEHYLRSLARLYGFDANESEGRALTRIAAQLDLKDNSKSDKIWKTFKGLEPNAQNILIDALNTTGTDGRIGLWIYYAPDMLHNSIKAHTTLYAEWKTAGMQFSGEGFENGLAAGLTAQARLYEKGRHQLLRDKTRRYNAATPGENSFGIFARTIALDLGKLEHSYDSPRLSPAYYKAIKLTAVGQDVEASFEENPTPIASSGIPKVTRMSSAINTEYDSDLGGWSANIGLFGVGGGGDAVTAAIALATKLYSENHSISFVASVRNESAGSATGGTAVGDTRKMFHADGSPIEEVLPGSGVYLIVATDKGNGRFFENSIAGMSLSSMYSTDGSILTYVVLYDAKRGPARIAEQASIVIADAARRKGTKRLDRIIGVDTGFDSGYRVKANITDAGVATPDQDHVVLAGLAALENKQKGLEVYAAAVAPGPDAPADAGQVLMEAGASQYEFTKQDGRLIQGYYSSFGLVGRDVREPSYAERYTKTGLALVAATAGRAGYISLDLPRPRVLDPARPWASYTHINRDMNAAYIMPASGLLRVIGYVATP